MVSAEYAAAELAAAAGITTRNMRAYRQRGLLDPPHIRGRKGVYGPEHLAQLRTVRALLARGLSLSEIASAQQAGTREQELSLLLLEPATPDNPERLGALMDSTLETLAAQRPGMLDRMVDIGVLQRGAGGSYLGDAGMLARANELLADGTRVRILSDIADATASGAALVGAELLDIAHSAGSRDARAYVDYATWVFREALRARLRARSPATTPGSKIRPIR
jgi:DNA-binding transcriptional MerR regulator